MTAKNIIIIITIANALRLAKAYTFGETDPLQLYLAVAVGLVMGAGIALGTANIAEAIPTIMTRGGKWRKPLTIAAFFFILGFETYFTALPYIQNGADILWSVFGALLPSLVIAGIAFSNARLFASDAPPVLSNAGTNAGRSRKSVKKAAKVYKCACKFSTENRYEWAGHARTCEKHKASQRVRIDETLLMKKG